MGIQYVYCLSIYNRMCLHDCKDSSFFKNPSRFILKVTHLEFCCLVGIVHKNMHFSPIENNSDLHSLGNECDRTCKRKLFNVYAQKVCPFISEGCGRND